jgi:hypothetical protein
MAELMRGGRPKMRMSTNSATHGGIDHRDRGSYRSRRPPDGERVKALDPIASPDAAKARAAMEDAAFTRDRLRTVLPRLHARLKEEAAEYAAQWEPESKRVEAQRDALAAEMRQVYPAAVAQLVDLFQRAAECDRQSSRINGLAPPGDHRRLRKMELTARGVEGLLQPDVWIAQELRLPYFARDRGPIYAWPPSTGWPARPPMLNAGSRSEALRMARRAAHAKREPLAGSGVSDVHRAGWKDGRWA